jgi:hypothetical protein
VFAIQAQRAGTKNQPSPEGLYKPGGRAPEVRHHTLRLFIRTEADLQVRGLKQQPISPCAFSLPGNVAVGVNLNRSQRPSTPTQFSSSAIADFYGLRSKDALPSTTLNGTELCSWVICQRPSIFWKPTVDRHHISSRSPSVLIAFT